ncbi:MAG: HEAT repeat domain-containing protein [Acidobacteria bacterium]|nr:HEAT repeat domain-containing protein [Acidobacteriota bacterium]
MRPIRLPAWLIIFVLTAAVAGQTGKANSLVKRLLELPAPPPATVSETDSKTVRPPEFYDPKNVPPDDAPLADLLDYWSRQNSSFDEFRYNHQPNRESLQRILAAIEENHALLTSYLKLLPDDSETVEMVRRIYTEDREALSYVGFSPVRDWLLNHSDVFIDELIESVRSIKAENGRINNQKALISLARVDWSRAKPFIDVFENDPERSESYALAKYVLYHHALKTGSESDAERYRNELEKLVEDKKGSYKSRDLAMDALVLGSDFPGRDDWYLSLLEDETLLELQENGYTGLTTLVRFMPNQREKWLDSMLRLLDAGKPAPRSVAVRNLYQINAFGQKEILVKMLPWLTDPNWARESSQRERKGLIGSFGEIDVPESVPGLISIVLNEDDRDREEAVTSLVRYRRPETVPIFRRLLFDNRNVELRDTLIEALVATDGFSVGEEIDALEGFADSMLAARKAENSDAEPDESEKTPSIEYSLGHFLANNPKLGDALVRATIARIGALEKSRPEIAALLLEFLQSWENPLADLEMLGRMNAGRVDDAQLIKMLTNRREIRERLANELPLWRGKSPVLRAFCTVISEDKAEAAAILREARPETAAALFAFARLVRMPLPVGEAAALMKNPDKLTALAAERYLESEDGVAARSRLLAEHRGEARMLGARIGFVPDEKADFKPLELMLNSLFMSVSSSYYASPDIKPLIDAENGIRREFTDNKDLTAVYGFLKNEPAGHSVLRVYTDRIVFTFYEDEARYWTKTVSGKEYEALLGFIVAGGIDALGSSYSREEEEIEEFVMLGRDGGRRILFSPGRREPKLAELANFFEAFRNDRLDLHYRLSEKIDGLRVLLADKSLLAQTVWKNGGDLRVLIADQTEREKIDKELEEQENSERAVLNRPDRENLYELQRRRRALAAYRHLSWRGFANGKLGPERVEQPAAIDYLADFRHGVIIGLTSYAFTPETLWRRLGDSEIRTEPFYGGRLVKIGPGGQTVVKPGIYRKPLVTPDGKWIVAAEADEEGFYLPNKVVRIELATGREIPVDIAPADEFYPVAYLSAQNRVLLYRGRDQNRLIISPNRDFDRPTAKNPSPATPEYYLLDPATGAARLVRGEFRPLEDQTFRALQPAGRPNLYWAAIYDEKLAATTLGYYDPVAFAFTPVMKIPTIALDSMDVWVDEKGAEVYFVYGGQLLALPLRPDGQK